jgi:uncharacterized protein YcnI
MRVLTLLLLLFVPATAGAHAVVYPKASAPGAYERYVLRVPNEKDAGTIRIEMRFPLGVRVISFQEVTGWSLEVARDSAGEIRSAAWTGRLSPDRFVEFPFMAVNPQRPDSIRWEASQTYEDGEVVNWAGDPESSTPASFTTIVADNGRSSTLTSYAIWVALGLSLLSLGISLRRG